MVALDTPVELPADFSGIITIYPDSENTNSIRRYWLIPSTARIVRRQDGKLAFGLQHSGVSDIDPDGINALLNVTMQPYIDETTLNNAKNFITKKATDEGATSVTFNFITPTETTCQILVGGQYIDWSGSNKTIIKGGSIEAGIPFQVKLERSFDVRCLTQAGGEEGSVFGALYTMKFKGVGNRVHFIITANLKETFEHFKAKVSASGWFGLGRASASAEWQKLKTEPFIKLTIISGTEEQIEKFHAQKIFDEILTQLTNRTGLFARQLKPNGLPDSPGGGGFMGWSFNASAGFELTKEEVDLRVEVDAQFTREQEIVFGMDFPTGGAEMKEGRYVKNLTNTDKPYPTSEDFSQQRIKHEKCLRAKLQTVKELLDQGLIDEELAKVLRLDVVANRCFAKVPSPERMHALIKELIVLDNNYKIDKRESLFVDNIEINPKKDLQEQVALVLGK